MKIEHKKIKEDIVQITTTDERWYEYKGKFYPSVTWIASFYPKGIQFMKWLASKGWNEAEAIKVMRGIEGSKVHSAIEVLLNGGAIKHDEKILNNETGEKEELSVQEYETIVSFYEWYKKVKPKTIKTEFNIITDKYAGTVDYLCEIEGQRYIIDFKTSQNIYPEHKIQISAYQRAIGNCKMAILQLGYNRNKNKYKFTEIEDCFDLFGAAYKIWDSEVSQKQPLQKDFPLEINLKKV